MTICRHDEKKGNTMRNITLTLALLLVALVSFAQEENNKLAGGDISMLPEYEAANVKYTDRNGTRITDLLTYFRDEAGFNIARVRIFVDPNKKTGVVQDLDYVLPLAIRIKEAGLKLMLDFHYSDTWADPSNQWTPAAWTSLTEEELADTIYGYTKMVLDTLVKSNAAPDYIQTGNEISYGMLWGPQGTSSPLSCNTSKDDNWERFRTLLTQAGKACREMCPDAKIIIHTERTGNWSTTKGIYERLSTMDYDIIGLSYYPEWHNNLNNLKNVITGCHNTFPDKSVMIVETGYYNNYYPSNATYKFQSTWPVSPEGQKKFLDDLVEAVKDLDALIGILYWFPEENPYNNHVYEPWYNHGLFNPKTGKVSDALFSLQKFRGIYTPVEDITPQPWQNGDIYTVTGLKLSPADNLPHGVYIQNGKKIVK